MAGICGGWARYRGHAPHAEPGVEPVRRARGVARADRLSRRARPVLARRRRRGVVRTAPELGVAARGNLNARETRIELPAEIARQRMVGRCRLRLPEQHVVDAAAAA